MYDYEWKTSDKCLDWGVCWQELASDAGHTVAFAAELRRSDLGPRLPRLAALRGKVHCG